MKKLFSIIGGAVGIYIVIVLMIAVAPATYLSQIPPGPGVQPLTALQDEGRTVYAANGCSYCHTQQVRPLEQDKIFGRPAAPGDFAYQTPELLGSGRTGPDLTNVGATKPSDIWQYIHLYDPRAVVPESIMPNFKFLFEVVDEVPVDETAVPIPEAFAPPEGKVIPTHEAKALVAYLLSLKQTPIPGYQADSGTAAAVAAGPTGPSPAGTPSGDPGDYAYAAARGESLYAANCSACHQANGEGIPGAFPPLNGNGAVVDVDPTLHIHTVLNGAQGTMIDGVQYNSAMPPFASQLGDAEIADIINYERSSWGNQAAHVTAADVAAGRAADE